MGCMCLKELSVCTTQQSHEVQLVERWKLNLLTEGLIRHQSCTGMCERQEDGLL